MAEEFQKGIAGILEKLSKMKEPEENKMTENQKFMTDVELKEQSPSLEKDKLIKKGFPSKAKMARGGRAGYSSGGAVLKGKKVGCQIK